MIPVNSVDLTPLPFMSSQPIYEGVDFRKSEFVSFAKIFWKGKGERKERTKEMMEKVI